MAFSSCDSTKYAFDYDKEADFESFKTYKFLPWAPDNSKRVNDLDKDRLYDAIRSELEIRAIQEVAKDPEMFVNIHVILQEKTGVTAYSDYYSPYGYSYGFGYGYGYGTTRYSEYSYTDGTIVIDVFDAKQKKLVWQVSAAGEVSENQKSYQKEAEIRNLMRKLFSFYPVKPRK